MHLRRGAQRDVALERAAALEQRDPAHCARRRRGSTFGRGVGLLGGGRRAPRGRRLRAGQRAVERDLLGHDLADPPDALADVVLADAREVQPHRGAAAAVEVRRPPWHERHVLAQRPREQVGRVDVVGQRRPDEQPALRARPRRLGREVLGQRVEHRVAPPPVELGQRAEVAPPVALGEVRDHEVLRQRRGAEVGCRPCRGSSSRAPAAAPPSTRAAARARGSSRTSRGRSRTRRRRASTASAAGRPRSAAGRTGCPRARAARAAARLRPAAAAAPATASRRPGSGTTGPCR